MINTTERRRSARALGTKPVQVQIRLSEAEFEAYSKAAVSEGFYLSQWIRYALRQNLKARGIEIEEAAA